MVSGFDFRYALDLFAMGSGAFRFAIGDRALAYFSVAIQRENPIAPSQSDPRDFKLTNAQTISRQETRTKHRHRDIDEAVNTKLGRLETAYGRRSCLKWPLR
jgi:hypothetical protein